jgi:hypothetical protein
MLIVNCIFALWTVDSHFEMEFTPGGTGMEKIKRQGRDGQGGAPTKDGWNQINPLTG